MTNIKKIITHNGNFHADEVLAVAMLRSHGFNQPVERKRSVEPSEIKDSQVMVIDIGGVCSIDDLNFDHHQDASISASNILIADWLVATGKMEQKVREKIASFLKQISDVDRGLIPNGGPAAGLNAIVRGFNPSVGSPAEFDAEFEKVVIFCQQIIENQIRNAQKAVEDEVRWDALERRGRVAIQEDINPILGWKEMAKRDDILVLVCPSNREGWQIISRNSEEFTIPPHDTQIFLHANRFMAAYPDRESAIAHAMQIV